MANFFPQNNGFEQISSVGLMFIFLIRCGRVAQATTIETLKRRRALSVNASTIPEPTNASKTVLVNATKQEQFILVFLAYRIAVFSYLLV